MTKISFIHTGYPKECIAPNIFVEKNFEGHPYIRGTGFFARRGRELYYITARHCLERHGDFSVEEAAARLRVLVSHGTGRIKSKDYIIFDKLISLREDGDPENSELADIVILPITELHEERQRKALLSRAIKLPPTGEWLNEFVRLPLMNNAIQAEDEILFSCIGYPSSGTETNVLDFKNNNDTITLQAAKFTGNLAFSGGDDRLRLKSISWKGDLDGFSGSPVFVGRRNEHGMHYALAGMLVMGGRQQIHFIRIGVIAQAFSGSA